MVRICMYTGGGGGWRKSDNPGFSFGLTSCGFQQVLSGLSYGICKMEAVLVPMPLGVVRILANVRFLHLERGKRIQRGSRERTGMSIRLWGEGALGRDPERSAEGPSCVLGVTLLHPLFSRVPLQSSLPTLLTPA